MTGREKLLQKLVKREIAEEHVPVAAALITTLDEDARLRAESDERAA